jgi:putative hemolysin
LIIQIVIIALLIGINSFFAAAEISVISLKGISLEKKAIDGDKKAQLLMQVLNEPSRFLATLQVGITLASFFTSAYSAVGLSKNFEKVLENSGIGILQTYGSNISFIFVTVLISFLSLLFGELVPKRIALNKSENIAYGSIGIIRIFSTITGPLVNALTFFTNIFVNLLSNGESDKENQITEEEIRMMINVGEEKGIFQKTETEMINSIFEFDDTTVGDVMTPRPDIIALDIENNFDETIKVVTEEKYSRIPVYKDSIDNIIGVLYVKDLIDYLAGKERNEPFKLRDFIREPFFVTEYKKIDIMMKEMQKRSVHISIVIDEYGSTAGLVTIEDLLEDIVGEIFDEYDDKEKEINIKGKDEFEIDGGINMSELNELLDTNYSENYDTVSGLILDSLGRFPKEGETIEIDNNKFTVLEFDNKRIKKILIKKESG